MLSKRLMAIADLVDDGSNIIDIGCDHALIDIYLTLNRHVKCIATDISKSSIKVSLDNVEKYDLSDQITLIQADGLSGINIDNIDTAIISGMGTSTILKILKGYKFNNLIIQSNNNLKSLRFEIIKKGYVITNEEIVYEKGRYYIIIKFCLGRKKYRYIDYFIGPIIRLNKRKMDRNYIQHLLNVYKVMLSKTPKKKIVERLFLNYKIYLLTSIK